jgi:hypothetical protein
MNGIDSQLHFSNTNHTNLTLDIFLDRKFLHKHYMALH